VGTSSSNTHALPATDALITSSTEGARRTPSPIANSINRRQYSTPSSTRHDPPRRNRRPVASCNTIFMVCLRVDLRWCAHVLIVLICADVGGRRPSGLRDGSRHADGSGITLAQRGQLLAHIVPAQPRL